MHDTPERDWKRLRELKPVTLERLCAQSLRHAAEITTQSGSTNHQRYLKLWKLMKEQDKEIVLAFNDHRRSTAFLKILQIHRLGLFTEEEFATFSAETRQHVLAAEAIDRG